jgi:hypothetical protein
MRGDSAQHDDHGSLFVSHEAKGDARIRQRVAVMQIEGRETHGLIDWIERIFGHRLKAP